MSGRKREEIDYGPPPRSRDPGVRRRRKRRGSKVIHYTLLLVFLAAVGVWLSMTTLFKVEQVLVVGSDKYTPTEIVAASGILNGDNMFRVDAAEVEKTLLSEFPYIESVDVRRKIPPAIELRVTQSVPAAAVLEEDIVTLITANGKVLEQGLLFIPEDIPVIKGLPINDSTPGGMLCDEAGEGLKMLTYLFDALAESTFGPVINVDITNPLSMKIIYQNRYLLLMGTEADIDYKLDFLTEIISTDPPDAQARIDVSNAARDKRARVRRITLAEALELERASDMNVVITLDDKDDVIRQDAETSS